MASLMSEEQFQCCICLDIFTNPVSIPCGHNFCLTCIKGYWDTRKRFECPLCKESFLRRPELRINRAFKDITEHFQRSLKVKAQQADEGDYQDIGVLASQCSPGLGLEPEAVSCDVCTGTKQRAVKSCLVCQGSYCENHLGPHQREPALQRHRLTDPATFATRGLCRKHERPLELYCRNDQTPVCVRCNETDHKGHNTIPMERENKKMRTQMKKTEGDLLKMVQDRLRKMDEIKHSVELSRISAEKDIEGSVLVFSELVCSIERSQAELIEVIEEKQKAAERRAEGLINELEREIIELQRRSTELEQLSHTEDHLHFLQSFPSLSTPPPTKDWSEISVYSDLCVDTVRAAMSQLVDTCRDFEKRLCEAELRRTQKYAVDVTLDPVTAASWLVLSSDGKQVSLGYQQNHSLPADPRRFDSCVCVLGKQGFATGRRYWVVQVGDKTDWDVGVAKESVNRKGSVTVRPDQGYWAVCRRKGSHLSACAGPSVPLHLRKKPRKVGVFVDFEEGLVSFYNMEAKAHIYSYRGCGFTETLYPYFNPCLHDDGKNTAPLVICSVEGEAGPIQEVVRSKVPPAALALAGRSRQSSVGSVSQHF
ncbi:zinc finger protein RFP-like isoform X1 [Salmo trutta]|uniref:Zinc-binding protein A33-like n=1 Tax=Salmo trutta TaxID=8032 RepID=A0A673WBX6_SALTR|nr:zinc finger protein RFP-like isoform X1 [Salmo trutta]